MKMEDMEEGCESTSERGFYFIFFFFNNRLTSSTSFPHAKVIFSIYIYDKWLLFLYLMPRFSNFKNKIVEASLLNVQYVMLR